MGLGVLDAGKEGDHIPGTVAVLDDANASTQIDPNLKYDRSGKEPILLVPQPSDDPNDPLNWSLWKRDLILLTLSIVSVIATTLSPLLAANTVTIAIYFRRRFTDVALLTGWHLLGVGFAGFIFVPTARVWGKRHLYVLGTIILIWSSAWGGATKECNGAEPCLQSSNYRSLLWARILQGVGLAPFEALVNASVGDLYHVHQRGTRMALSNLCLFGGAFGTPIIVGKMTHTMGWDWPFYFVAIFAGVALPFVVFCIPETAYKRDESLDIDSFKGPRTSIANGTTVNSNSIELEQTPRKDFYGPGSIEEQQSPLHETSGKNTTIPPKATYLQSLKLFNGRKTDESFLRLLLRPFPLFLHPGILWACLIQGTLIGWTVMIGVVLAAVLMGPPLIFSEAETGYMYTGAFIGALIGFLIAGILSDWSVKKMTRWNRGIYEPEFRMLLVVPQLVLGCIGLYLFGWVCERPQLARFGWFLPCFFFALEVAGMVIGAVVSALYIVDAHRDIAVEAFTCQLVFKNVFSFGLTFKAYDWILEGGIWPTFRIVGSVQIAVCALTIPMYILGKRNRAFFARHNVFFVVADAVADAPGRMLGLCGVGRKRG